MCKDDTFGGSPVDGTKYCYCSSQIDDFSVERGSCINKASNIFNHKYSTDLNYTLEGSTSWLYKYVGQEPNTFCACAATEALSTDKWIKASFINNEAFIINKFRILSASLANTANDIILKVSG